MQPWSEEHRAFAVETYFFFNNDPATVTHRVFRRHFDIGRNGKVPTRQTILNSSSSMALQPGVCPGLLYNTPPSLSIPCSVSSFIYSHLFQVRGHVIQPSHFWSSSSSCCIIGYLHHLPWLQHSLNVPCAKYQVRDSRPLSPSGIHYIPRLIIRFRNN